MKRIFTNIQKKASKLLLLTVLAGAMASCDSVLDHNEGDCTVKYQVRFKYDYNIKSTDAFAQEVKRVALYAFDENGQFIYLKTDEGELLAEDEYSMSVDIEPGDYHLVAWAGTVDDNGSFAIPVLTPGTSDIQDLTVKTNREIATRADGTEEQHIVKKNLASLFHGESVRSFTRSASAKEQTITIDLTKNTNTLRIVLQQLGEEKIDINKFDFSIYDENGWMNYDNTLLDDDLLTYKPYYQNVGSVTRAGADGSTSNISVAVAELSVARLVVENNPTLRITNNTTGEVAIQVPLIKYLELLRASKYKEMSLQEYLDREDVYNMTFFLDKDMTWIQTHIIINDWEIRDNSTDINPK